MAQYVYSGRSRPCPICGRTKDQDCRWNEEVVFCHTHVDQDGAADGYVYRGATADGMWGQYFAVTAPPEKPTRPQQRQDYFYPSRAGQPLVKVTRVDRGNGAKFFVQYHWNGQQWVKGLTPEIRSQVPIYRYRDVQNALSIGQSIWMVEGEGCADALWAIGIPATTTLGGSKKYRSYGNYAEDLQTAQLVLCPDRDQVGSRCYKRRRIRNMSMRLRSTRLTCAIGSRLGLRTGAFARGSRCHGSITPQMRHGRRLFFQNTLRERPHSVPAAGAGYFGNAR